MEELIKRIEELEASTVKQLAVIERNTLLGAKNTLTIDDVALLTGISKSYLYKLTCTHQIPHYKPNGKYMYFDRGEIEAWMKQNKVLTTDEAEQQAVAYVVNKER